MSKHLRTSRVWSWPRCQLPTRTRKGPVAEAELAARVTDYLAGMTDRYCIRTYTDLEVPRAFAR